MNYDSIHPFLSLAVFFSAGLTILSYYLRPPRRALIYICKPLTTILILAAALLPGGIPADRYALMIAIGLFFSLLGDIWQMLSRRHFLKALTAFLVTHICYILAFLVAAPAPGFFWPILPLAGFGAAVLAYLWPALSTPMKAAVGAYVCAIVLMAALAAGRALADPSPAALSAAAGALLFLTSDTFLAVNRFRRQFSSAQAVILGTYFAGQLLIALSVGWRTA